MPSQVLEFSSELCFLCCFLVASCIRPVEACNLQHGDMVPGRPSVALFPLCLTYFLTILMLPCLIAFHGSSQSSCGCGTQGAATLLHQHENQLSASSRALAAHLSAALPLNHEQGSQPFITPEAYDTLCDSTHLVTRLAQEAQAADQQHSYGSKAPAWKQASDTLQGAAAECASVCSQDGAIEDCEDQLGLQEAGGGSQEGEAVQRLSQQWETLVESLVKNVLVWAQNVQGGGPEEAGRASKTSAGVD